MQACDAPLASSTAGRFRKIGELEGLVARPIACDPAFRDLPPDRMMCGLFASIAFLPERNRTDLVVHRGPDGAGWKEFVSPAGPVALGHRRLAIIDLSDAGLQPMSDRCGRHHLVFNGEIYNYLELRNELRAKGHSFVSDTDSEVLLAAYAEWGEACLDRLLGMFAFMIWDERDKRLFAARDRFGIKPLYVAANSKGIAFGSEIKQLLGLPGVTGRMNLSRIRDYLAAGMADHTPETMFEGIGQLPPGCCALIEASRPWSGRFETRRWYAIPSHNGLKLSEGEAAERFRELLTDSVRMHMRSDVPVGSCLSGGLDSSSVVGLVAEMVRGTGTRVHTVTACYDDRTVDERPFVEAVVEKAGVEPHHVFPRAEDVFENASEITWHQDEPFGSSSIFAQWCVFKEARRAGIKVMLDGQGADEQLAGYHGHYGFYMAELVRRMRLLTLVQTLIERRRVHGVTILKQAQLLVFPLLPASLRGYAVRQRDQLQRGWLASEAFGNLGPGRSALDVASDANGLPRVNGVDTLCLALTFGSNLQMLLHWEDRNSMAHSIEARVPFLDHRLVEFALALGSEHKVVGSETKRVLRRAMHEVLPEAVRMRRNKIGFATPEEAWFRGPLKGMLLDRIEATLTRFPGLLNERAVRSLAGEALAGRRKLDFALWRIANLGIWGERFSVSA